MRSIYSEKHQLKGYPGIFDGTKDKLPSFCLNFDYDLYERTNEIHVDKEYFVIWLPEKVAVDKLTENFQ